MHKVCLKSYWKGEKTKTIPGSLEPAVSDLRLNAYRSLPGGQVFSPCCWISTFAA